jgi:hypothetical protein
MFGSKARRIRALEAELHTARQTRRDLLAANNVLRHKLDLAQAGELRDAPVSTRRFREPVWVPEGLRD